jgi:hypothetical protein
MLREKSTLLLLTLAAVIFVPFPAAAQSSIAGEWQGATKVHGTRLRLALHIIASPSGTLTATIDSLDQNSRGIPVSAITFDNATLKLSVPQVQAAYEGKLSRDGTELSGTWIEGKRSALKFNRVPYPTRTTPRVPVGGDWQGRLSAGEGQVHLVLHLNTTNYTRLEGTLDDLDQSANGIPLSQITFKDHVLQFTVDSIRSSYVGTLSDDGNEIDGVWTRGQSFRLIFQRAANPRR